MNLALELLKALGFDAALALKIIAALETATEVIADPVRREAEIAAATAELLDGKIPTIIAEVVK